VAHNVEENEDICMAAGGFIFLTSCILKVKIKQGIFRSDQR